MDQSPRESPTRRPGALDCFAMGRAEGLALLFLIVFSIVAFLPVWREPQIAGLSIFGWLMAALMLISPVLMLIVFRRGRGK